MGCRGKGSTAASSACASRQSECRRGLQRSQTAAPKQADDTAAAAQGADEELTIIPDAARFQSEPDFWEGEGWEVRCCYR